MAALQQRLLEREVYFSSYGMGCMNLATSDGDIAHLLQAVHASIVHLDLKG